MKLITLNILGGAIYKDFIEFIKEKKNGIDIFCFQEVFKSDRSLITPGTKGHSNILDDLRDELTDFDFLFSPFFHGRDYKTTVDYPLSWGNAIFWKKGLNPLKTGYKFTHLSEGNVGFFPNPTKDIDMPKNFQYLIFNNFMILNIHGYWAPFAKIDTPERIEQSEQLIDFIAKNNLPAILAGDFNLKIDTKSVDMFEENEFRNLVKESGAATTRTKHYDIKWRKIDKYADYIFTSYGISVMDFKVLSDEVSDHLPLFIDFEV